MSLLAIIPEAKSTQAKVGTISKRINSKWSSLMICLQASLGKRSKELHVWVTNPGRPLRISKSTVLKIRASWPPVRMLERTHRLQILECLSEEAYVRQKKWSKFKKASKQIRLIKYLIRLENFTN